MTIADARKFVGQSQGLPSDFDGSIGAYSALTAAQQVALNRGVLQYIVANPANFTAGQVQTANTELGRTSDIEDTSATLYEILEAAGDSAQSILVDPLASLGNGISGAISALGKILPYAAVAGGLYLAYAYTRRAAAK